MKLELDTLHMTLLAALGLGLACAPRPSGPQADAEGSDDADTGDADGDGDTGDGDGDGDGDTGDGDGDTGDGDGDGDTGDGDGDGDGDTGDGDGDTGDGDTGDGDGDGDTGDGDGEPPEPFECLNPQPILQLDSNLPSGFVTCEGGFIHRDEKLDALDPQGPDDAFCLDGPGACNTAADCLEEAHGRCLLNMISCMCDYGCASDADCELDEICAPAGVVGVHSTCVSADCTIDDECGDGLCGLSDRLGCCGVEWEMGCADPVEECHVDEQCPDMPCPDSQNWIVDWHCAYRYQVDGDEWLCGPPASCTCDCGRPFFVEGEARVAPTLGRRDWSFSGDGELLDVDVAIGARLADHWTQIARFEHASIASFARFGLQLLRLGAPPKLLRDTSRALADEIEHARLAFGLASAYAGAPVGPGGLDVAGAIEPTMDLYEIVDGLIAEACVGETLAAIEAHEAACWAEDPAVASVLERIAADEWRHAQLGWGALGWMLAQGGERLRSFALARFELVLGAVAGEAETKTDLELRRCGVLDEALRAQVRREGIAKVIRPCVEALGSAQTLTV